MKHALSAVVLSFAASVPALASAQELGSKGDAVFSVDRLMGISSTRGTLDDGPVNRHDDWSSFSFGWRAPVSPFDVPRLSFDYLPINHLSVGGSLGYFSIDPDGGGDTTGFILNPRVGYVYAFGRVVGIWPRGGLTYHSADRGSLDENGLALTLECPFTFSPVSNFAFHIGPTFDIDMFGEHDFGGVNVDYKYRVFGINAGLLGWF